MNVTMPQGPHAEVELNRLGDEIAGLSAHLDAATARLLDLIREFDARGGWNTGFLSCAAWLSWRVGLDPGAARERVRVARALGMLPRLAHALARGERSYSKVRALTRVATPKTEERLLAGGRLTPEVGAVVMQALAAARETLYHRRQDVSEETPSTAQQQADALALVAETALHRGIDPGAPGERYQVVVHVDADVLADPDAPGQSVLEDGVRNRRPDTHDSACAPARAALSRSRLSLPRLRATVRPGSSHPPLGARRSHEPSKPGAPVSPTPPGGSRGGLPARATARRRVELPVPRWPAAARKPASGSGARRSRRGATSAARRARASPSRADGDARLAGRASGRRMGDRRLTSARRHGMSLSGYLLAELRRSLERADGRSTPLDTLARR